MAIPLPDQRPGKPLCRWRMVPGTGGRDGGTGRGTARWWPAHPGRSTGRSAALAGHGQGRAASPPGAGDNPAPGRSIEREHFRGRDPRVYRAARRALGRFAPPAFCPLHGKRRLPRHGRAADRARLPPAISWPFCKRSRPEGRIASRTWAAATSGKFSDLRLPSGKATTDPTRALRGALVKVETRHHPPLARDQLGPFLAAVEATGNAACRRKLPCACCC